MIPVVVAGRSSAMLQRKTPRKPNPHLGPVASNVPPVYVPHQLSHYTIFYILQYNPKSSWWFVSGFM